MRSHAKTHRPLIMGRNGAVASNHPAATQVGLDVLKAGGNAADAAVATALALGVVEPHMSGLGGDGFYHAWSAATGVSTVFTGLGAAPAAATPARYAEGMPLSGPQSVSTPGTLAGLAAMHAALGDQAWAALCAPAATLARDGVPATHTYRHFATTSLARLHADARSGATFLRDGEPPALGTLIVQPELAATLDRIASEGAEGFYRGTLAADLVAAFAEMDVPITAADLARVRARVEAPLSAAYRGFEVRQTPPPSTGFVLLEELGIVERFDLAALEGDSAELVHLLVEAKKLAFLDRERHAGTPDLRPEPLWAADYVAAQAARIDPARAAAVPLATAGQTDGDTTYFCVVDATGNCVSAIQSLNNAFGSGVTAGRTGVLLNNRMTCWHLEPTHANALQPGNTVRHTMNAPMVFQGGRPWALLGTPGADNQVQVNLQALVGLIDFGLDPQQVAEAPRWTSEQPGQEANWPHGGADALTLEAGFPDTTVDGLRARGHTLHQLPRLGGACSLECIRIIENGVRMAGSDPRRDGWAGAY